MQKITKILKAVSEKIALPTKQPTLIWKPSFEYLQIKIFFQKSASVFFLLLKSPNFMEKLRKILTAISEKTALPTNYYQQHQSYRTLITPVQKSMGNKNINFYRIQAYDLIIFSNTAIQLDKVWMMW